MQTWKEKLHPSRFAGLSRKMVGTIGYISDHPYTKPPFRELLVTRDGFVLAGQVDGTQTMIGQESDVHRNWESLLDGAGLTLDERSEAERAYQSHVHPTLDVFEENSGDCISFWFEEFSA